jgi:hypothetical protein
VKKGGARLLGRAAVRLLHNIIDDLKIRLQSPHQAQMKHAIAFLPARQAMPIQRSQTSRRGPLKARGGLDQTRSAQPVPLKA